MIKLQSGIWLTRQFLLRQRNKPPCVLESVLYSFSERYLFVVAVVRKQSADRCQPNFLRNVSQDFGVAVASSVQREWIDA